jgi:hypothetical protein
MTSRSNKTRSKKNSASRNSAAKNSASRTSAAKNSASRTSAAKNSASRTSAAKNSASRTPNARKTRACVASLTHVNKNMYGFWKDKLENSKNLKKLDKVTTQMRAFYKDSKNKYILAFFTDYDKYSIYRNGAVEAAGEMQQRANELEAKHKTLNIYPLIHNLSLRFSEDNKEIAQCYHDALTVSIEIEQEWKRHYEQMAILLSNINKHANTLLPAMRSRKKKNAEELTSDAAKNAAIQYEVGIVYFEEWNHLYDAISVELSAIVTRVEKKLAEDEARVKTIEKILSKSSSVNQSPEKESVPVKKQSPESASVSKKKQSLESTSVPKKKQSLLETTQLLPLQNTLSKSLRSTKNLLLSNSSQQDVFQKSQDSAKVQSKPPSAKKTRRSNWFPFRLPTFRVSRKNPYLAA